MTLTPPTHRLRRLAAALAGAVLVAGSLTTMTAQAAPAGGHAEPVVANPFGSNVTIISPDMSVTAITDALKEISDKQLNDEMGTNRYAVLFRPGTYGTASEPLHFTLGYYTEVAGLGANPGDVTINGSIDVYNRCLGEDNTNCSGLDTFWRTLWDLTLKIDKSDVTDGCKASADFWAVSQAVSMRRVDISGANLSLMDYCSAGPQYASGGHIAD